MSATNMEILRVFIPFVILLLIIGFYYILATRNLVRILLGVEIITKATLLSIIVVGYVTNNMLLAQSLAIIMIIIEVFVIAVAAGIIIQIYKVTGSVDARNIRNLRG
jgi:NADH-ubiquinone/plastoquinone oxidoreductase chain 4L.